MTSSLARALCRRSLLAITLSCLVPAITSCTGCAEAPAVGDPFDDPGRVGDGGVAQACEAHDDCPLGTRCGDEGCAVATRDPPAEGCFSDEECEQGYACATSTGRCVELPPPSAPPPTNAPCDDGDTRACGSKVGACEYGVERCVAGAWSGGCEDGVGPTDEDCDGVDDDCNSAVDDIVTSACFLGIPPCALEGTLSCAADGSGSLCVVPPAGGESCNGVDDNGDTCVDEGFDLGGACAVGRGACRTEGERVCSLDGNGTVCGAEEGEGSDESCNGIDDDCDGVVDNGCDDDNDDYCDGALPLVGAPAVCPLTSGAATLDCDDGNAAIHPGASEVCDNTVDENCDGALSEGCDAPVAVCDPSALVTAPFVTVQLDGSSSYDGAGGALSYSWAVTTRPAGSTANPTPTTSATPSFTPDLAGDYEVTLTVENAQGIQGTCVVSVNAVPPETIHVQLVWQESAGDLDLHLTKHDATPAGAFFDTSAARKDTWWATPANDWGTTGSVDGDASLDVDDRAGFGPENINIDVNPAAGVYHVGVHVYCEQNQTSPNQFSGPEGPRNAKVRIFCAGALVDEIPVGWRTLEQTGAFWTPAKIQWTGSACNVTRIDSIESGVKYCRALGGCGATAAYGLANDCRAERKCDNNAGCRSYEMCLGNGNNKKCLLQSCAVNGDCPAGHRCAAEHGNVCTR